MWGAWIREENLIRKMQFLRAHSRGEIKECFKVLDFHICCNLVIHAFKITLPGHRDPASPWLCTSQRPPDASTSNNVHSRPATSGF